MLKLKQLNKWHESNKLKSDWKFNTLVRARIHIRTRVAYHTMWIHSTFQISITTSTTTTLWLQAIHKFSHNIDLRFNFVYFFFDTTTTKLLCFWMQMDCGHANHALFFPFLISSSKSNRVYQQSHSFCFLLPIFPFVTLIKWQIFCLMTCNIIIYSIPFHSSTNYFLLYDLLNNFTKDWLSLSTYSAVAAIVATTKHHFQSHISIIWFSKFINDMQTWHALALIKMKKK